MGTESTGGNIPDEWRIGFSIRTNENKCKVSTVSGIPVGSMGGGGQVVVG